ncbi:hypothetical protein N24_1898 [Corynebacterium suranareeae]|uniref:Helicase ATP-binding domain-containing protein n=1 Tax=Corynebacterium suranareeae TaxID=2506452 RepID=A0A160PUB6_9CORY|nr:AAA family ATPase [Corynebacterium suranareeae]BAU96160.1 hypothetical protein N24_1898 [Corynebacterium suranareeae]
MANMMSLNNPAAMLAAYNTSTQVAPPPQLSTGAGEVQLSAEQQAMIDHVLAGKDVIVDATVGSGKTTAIQRLCSIMGADHEVLYLTYSKLLKIDAQQRVRGAKVQNYHGIVYPHLLKAGIKCGISESIREFNKNFKHISGTFPSYDLMVIDEYQDINEDYAELLRNIKSVNPLMQIVMVGDLEQKVRSDTTLDPQEFAAQLCEDPVYAPFTQSFRIGEAMAAGLSDAWNKPIVGVNTAQQIEYKSFAEAVVLIQSTEPSNLLCLGSRNGQMSDALNVVERKSPAKFNKKTVFASIRDGDSQIAHPDDAAVFTTFDSSKGLERDTCVVFDYDEEFWDMRLGYPNVDPVVMRNVFLVAASRGKNKVVFVRSDSLQAAYEAGADWAAGRAVGVVDNNTEVAPEVDVHASAEESEGDVDEVKQQIERTMGFIPVSVFKELPELAPSEYERPISVTEAFDFKYAENVEACFDLLDVKRLDNGKGAAIEVNRSDGLIDLSPTVGNFQEAVFFKDYNVHTALSAYPRPFAKNLKRLVKKNNSVWRNCLIVTAASTEQMRYVDQVRSSIPVAAEKALVSRLGTRLNADSRNQIPLILDGEAVQSKAVRTPMSFAGVADAVHKDVLYELKFVSELTHPMFLQLAMYLVMSGMKDGILWNTRTDEAWQVRVPDPKRFLNAVVLCVSKQDYRVGNFDLPSTGGGAR